MLRRGCRSRLPESYKRVLPEDMPNFRKGALLYSRCSRTCIQCDTDEPLNLQSALVAANSRYHTRITDQASTLPSSRTCSSYNPHTSAGQPLQRCAATLAASSRESARASVATLAACRELGCNDGDDSRVRCRRHAPMHTPTPGLHIIGNHRALFLGGKCVSCTHALQRRPRS